MGCKLPDKFKLLDKNFNELQIPVGVRAAGIEVSSIARERNTATVEGIPGIINYGSDFSTRPINLIFTLTTDYDFDFSLMRNELFDLLTYNDSLYLVENALPSRMIEIGIDESVLPDKIALHFYSKIEVSAETVGLPFWRTKYTSQDIEKDGYSALVEKYGTADNIHINYVKYTHTANTFSIYNSGNVTIDPRNMMLYIQARYVKSTGNFTIENLTTGEKFIYKEKLDSNHLTIEGIKVKMGVYNRLRDTNREFISLVPGENKIKISNGTFEEIKFDCPFYYK
ncbi:phage tail domain-containing protein [Mammaliicoccus fleurettii]|uniref:phage tail domain-containing protein n=1 Tax=Mammaliicoccus fleurettii TaxID=150056 RepID=UPI002DBA8233|nr:phage tail domain-containing protein [Mammaliicoccus fleurettii]MEB7723382.1 phage tail family protein [Mammaliicoccus fleurettii]